MYYAAVDEEASGIDEPVRLTNPCACDEPCACSRSSSGPPHCATRTRCRGAIARALVLQGGARCREPRLPMDMCVASWLLARHDDGRCGRRGQPSPVCACHGACLQSTCDQGTRTNYVESGVTIYRNARPRGARASTSCASLHAPASTTYDSSRDVRKYITD